MTRADPADPGSRGQGVQPPPTHTHTHCELRQLFIELEGGEDDLD